MGLGAFEAYLVEHGRDWERYAYVKARLLSGHEFAADVFDYTRNLYGVSVRIGWGG